MALVLLPTTALAEEIQLVEDVTFNYAYDAQRSPTFPTQRETEVTMSTLRMPLLSGTQSKGNAVRKVAPAGSWRLERVGTYFDVKRINKNSEILDSIVDAVLENYSSLNEETVVIHELKEGVDHIAYGVVLAYNATDGIAVFVGDLWNLSGAGYLLSTAEISGTSVTVTADMIATDFVKELSISLSQTGRYSFPEAAEGYGDQTALTVTVTNTGNAATGDLTVTLSGEGQDSFKLSTTSISNIPIDENAKTATFTVTPKTDLAAGTYTATVTVSGTGIDAKSFDVTFTVEAPAPAVRPRPTTPATSTTTIDSPKTADNSGLFLWTVLLFVSGAGVLGTAVYSNRKRRAE